MVVPVAEAAGMASTVVQLVMDQRGRDHGVEGDLFRRKKVLGEVGVGALAMDLEAEVGLEVKIGRGRENLLEEVIGEEDLWASEELGPEEEGADLGAEAPIGRGMDLAMSPGEGRGVSAGVGVEAGPEAVVQSGVGTGETEAEGILIEAAIANVQWGL